MSFGDHASLFLNVLWNIYNHAHTDLLRIPRTSAGPFTEMPNCLAPSKSLLLCVTIVPTNKPEPRGQTRERDANDPSLETSESAAAGN